MLERLNTLRPKLDIGLHKFDVKTKETALLSSQRR